MKFYQQFRREFKALTYGYDWRVQGILRADGTIMRLGTDSKSISSIFEEQCKEFIEAYAEWKGYLVKRAPQNKYPDYTLYKSDNDKEKIAIEIKTTHITKTGFISYTLGTFKKNSKGVVCPLEDYGHHIIIGFTYVRTPKGVYSYDNVEFFINEKWRITGKGMKSGNTKNMGSIVSRNIKDFSIGCWFFKTEQECHDYWTNHSSQQ